MPVAVTPMDGECAGSPRSIPAAHRPAATSLFPASLPVADHKTMTVMDTERQNLRAEVRALCRKFDDEYWRRCDEERAYQDAFVEAMTAAGYLSALIPAEYGGLGLGITDAAIILEEVNRSGGHSAACHAQMYTMGALLKHGRAEQKRRYL